MEDESKSKLSSVTITVVVIAIALLAFFLWQYIVPAERESVSDDRALREAADELNPFAPAPTANPFSETDNPYGAIRTNPFE
jgi:hypothetical protein